MALPPPPSRTGFGRRTFLSLAAGAGVASMVPWHRASSAFAAPTVIGTDTLSYPRPATSWDREALPIGNARLGAMPFGGTDVDRVQFNEASMWGGVNNYDNALAGRADDAFDTSMNGFGSYLDFGELSTTFDVVGVPVAGGSYQDSSTSQTVAQTVDGQRGTKWCVIAPPSEVVWQLQLPAEGTVTGYSLTSGDDVPDRDPVGWVLSGSADGSSWTALDTQSGQAPFAQRSATRYIGIANTRAFRYYRIVFTPRPGVSHFQIAGVSLDGLPLAGTATAPGGPYQDSRTSQTVAQTVDGQRDTKWCVIAPPSQVVWQLQLPSDGTVTGYSLTSAEDVPDRDPVAWTLSGSADGSSWTALDTQSGQAPFAQRLATRFWPIANTRAFRYYRIVFTPRPGVSHFQIAGVSLDGLPMSGSAVTGYQRSLDLRTGVHTTRFTRAGSEYVREAFVSRAAEVVVVRYSTNAASGLSGTVALRSSHAGASTTASSDGRTLAFDGTLGNTLRHAAAVRVVPTGGTVRAGAGTSRFSGCSQVVLLLDARTDYAMVAPGWRNGQAPRPRAEATVAAASSTAYEQLRSAHTSAFSALMDRVAVTWGASPADVAALPTDQRLSRYAGGSPDPSLEQAMFRYSRYMLISSSRRDGLPANLQGLWNNTNTPPWAGDFHTNINVQMNYWGAETTDLGESHLALAEFIKQVAVPSRTATKNAFGSGVRGWAVRTGQSAFGGNAWAWNAVGSAWYCQHLWEHFAFTQDRAYLRDLAYPIIKEICQFWQDRLVQRPAGLMAPMGWSPEHGPVEDGVMYDQQLIWDLFQNYRDASTVLGVDADFRAVVTDLQSRLAPNKIGSWGQLQEWQTDRDDPRSVHRHTSHLFGIFPGRQITLSGTPALAAAGLISLKARCGERDGVPLTPATVTGDSRQSWAWTWRTALFARLGDGARAHTMLRGLLSFNTLPNLFTITSGVFQIDGNLGISGAITEMLLQSHTSTIELLPALPPEWRKAGSFSGLRARGGYKVDCTWADGVVTSYTVTADRAPNKNPIQVRVNGKTETVTPA